MWCVAVKGKLNKKQQKKGERENKDPTPLPSASVPKKDCRVVCLCQEKRQLIGAVVCRGLNTATKSVSLNAPQREDHLALDLLGSDCELVCVHVCLCVQFSVFSATARTLEYEIVRQVNEKRARVRVGSKTTPDPFWPGHAAVAGGIGKILPRSL